MSEEEFDVLVNRYFYYLITIVSATMVGMLCTVGIMRIYPTAGLVLVGCFLTLGWCTNKLIKIRMGLEGL